MGSEGNLFDGTLGEVEEQLRAKLAVSSESKNSNLLKEVIELGSRIPERSNLKTISSSVEATEFFTGELANLESELRKKYKAIAATGSKIALTMLKKELPKLTIKSEDSKGKDADGWNTLHRATLAGDVSLMAELIKSGVDVTARTKTGQTPLHIAVMMELEEAARLLLRAGADPNAKDNFGKSPISEVSDEFLIQLGLDNAVVDNSELRVQDLQKQEMIGRGTFGNVFRGYWRGSEIAIKEVDWDRADKTEAVTVSFRSEVEILKKLRHPHILLFMSSNGQSRPLRMVTELCRGGDLHKVLHESDIKLSPIQRLACVNQIAEALAYLHTSHPPVIHGDIKSLNILLSHEIRSKDSKVNCKLADFNTACEGPRIPPKLQGATGTYFWSAPEVLQGDVETSTAADVYSFAIFMFEVLSQQLPFENFRKEMLPVFAVVIRVCHDFVRPDVTGLEPSPLVEVMKLCWDPVVEKRPTIIEALRRIRETNCD
jgi:Protein kinase domain/Ankyrin repeats (3 copies)